jgi:membrane-bound serine protease (ClpP class)
MVGGSPALLGATGQLIEFSNGEGWAMIRGEHWRVSGANDLRPGEQVRVTRARSQSLEVAADGTDLTTGASSS